MQKKTILTIAACMMIFSSLPSTIQATTSTTYKSTIESVKLQQDKVYQDIQQLDVQLAERFKEIRVIEEQLTELNAMQKVFEKEMKDVSESIEQRKEFMSERLVSLQKREAMDYLDVLLGSDSITDLFHRAYTISMILEADKEMIETFKNDVNTLEELEQLLYEGKTMYEQKVKELQELTNSLNEQIEGKERVLLKLQQDEQLLKNDYYNLLNQVDAPLLENTTFIRPSAGRVTSEFGYRIHPIFKVDDYHKGIDIAIGGTAVELVAVADGLIEYAGYLGGYGYVVFVKHELEGHIFTSVYAHQQGIEVEVGQKVKQGDFIGFMGSSGDSTGQHLHFEMHVGQWTTGQKNAVNPRLFINF